MVKVLNGLLITTILISCNNKEPELQAHNLVPEIEYEYAIDVPVNNPGVIINIDTISFFKSDRFLNDKSKETQILLDKIKQLNTKFDTYQIIKDNTIRILDENNYKFTIIDKFNENDFPVEQLNKENFKELLNFKELNKNYSHKDIVLVTLKNGFDYNEEDPTKYVAKTYAYINIINTEKGELKFAESIGGTKYFDDKIENISVDNLAKIMHESLQNTIDITDKKY